MAEHMALRTHVIDAAVNEGVAHGARQLVVVGAGLDSRAHRLAALADCDVYEVDFPSTQALKRESAQALPVVARTLHYASCDFERTGLEAALRSAGFSTQLATVWIWEGVTMYLTEAMVASSLETMARLSAPRSRLVATYLEPVPSELKAIASVLLSILSAVSEPVRSNYDVEAMATMLRAHDFSPLRDVSPRELAARYEVRFPSFALGAPLERIVVAERRAET
jgi:methyltransferase (TIGR00027 family)